MNSALVTLLFVIGSASALVILEPFAAQSLSFAIQPPPLTAQVFQPTFHHLQVIFYFSFSNFFKTFTPEANTEAIDRVRS